jgi:hypothetical protein
MTKAAIIQSQQFFTKELQKEYLGLTPLYTSNDEKKIYNFIIKNAKKKCIFKFVLDVDSGVLDKFIDYISFKKKSKSKYVSILDNCTFIATRSNATSIREKKNLKHMNIYFTLTTVQELLRDYNDGRLMVVSNTNTPYYDEIYNFKNTNMYRLSDLTVKILNEYTGSTITSALNNAEEYKHFVSLILKSKYRKIVQFFEVYYLEELKPLKKVVFSMNSITAGSGLSSDLLKYNKIKFYNMYENTALTLAGEPDSWIFLIRNNIISSKKCTFGKLINIINDNV